MSTRSHTASESDDITLTNTAVLKEVRLAPRSEWDAYEAATGAQMLEADRLASARENDARAIEAREDWMRERDEMSGPHNGSASHG